MSATQQPRRGARFGGVRIGFSAASMRSEWLLLLTVAATVVADQISKLVIKGTLALGESWPAEGVFRISHGTNSGAVWGLFPGRTGILTIASIVAIAFIIYYYRTQAVRNQPTRFTVGLLLGGAIGNLIDRLRMGEVVDFIDVGWWPAFNLADSSIVVGMTLLIATLLLTGEPKSRIDQRSEAAD
ncbi:MAG: signal peptidase II [SAR202 cluster bacterium]|mgnify:CR=1 FL=1|nr:signal peptidase II [Chloroflexota bacterium]MDP6421874.1 signal peptidase II [SAR202 cluster bacterium]HAL48934.1 signal peptidase II [Dehalococcoidia bacterium]MDP6665222.1 signal peptidase II [SAR202 cluster bacterium]MDP6799319.1 signal peptidase II [SAR202 cluster bacterium]